MKDLQRLLVILAPTCEEGPTKADQNTPPLIMDRVHLHWPDGVSIDFCTNRWAIELGFVDARVNFTKEDDFLSKTPDECTPDGHETTAWFQPDYGDPEPFCEKLLEVWAQRKFRCLGLAKGDHSTAWWKMLVPHVTAIGTVRRRVHHYLGFEKRKNTYFASTMFYLHNDPSTEVDEVLRLQTSFGELQHTPNGACRPIERDAVVDWWPSPRLIRHETTGSYG